MGTATKKRHFCKTAVLLSLAGMLFLFSCQSDPLTDPEQSGSEETVEAAENREY